MDQLVASGVDPKAAEAIIKLVETTVKSSIETAVKSSIETAVKSSVETAVRSFGIADQSRQQEAARLPASKESIGWTGIIAIAAVIGIQLGAIYWLDNNMQAGLGRVYEEFGRVREEISDLRNHTFAELSSVRAELGSVRVELGMLRSDVGGLRSDVESLQTEVGELGGRMTNLEMLFQDRLP